MGYLGDGRYDLLEMLKASKNPQINYEGLYEEPADTSINLDPMYNMGSRQFGDMRMGMPQATGIMQQAPTQNFEFLSSAYEDENEDDQQVDYLPDQKSSLKDSLSNMGKKFGLSSLLGLITGNPILGLIGRGAGGLGALNDRMQNSDFGQSKNLMDYLDMRKYGGAQGRRDFSARNMAQARGITKSLASRPSSTSGGYQQGPGGSGAQSQSQSQSQAGPGFSGSGSASEMGSF